MEPTVKDEIPLLVWSQLCERLQPEGEMELQNNAGLLRDGGVVTIIGARESNAPEYWKDPRCVFADGDAIAAKGLPSNTKAVIFTRWVGHQAFKTVLNETRRRNIKAFPIQGTGALKRTLAALLEVPPVVEDSTVVPMGSERTVVPEFSPVETPAAPQAEPASGTTVADDEDTMVKQKEYKRGEVAAWVRDRFVSGMKVADIMRAAEEEKVPFKESSISSAFFALKRGVPLPPKKGATAAPAIGLPPTAASTDGVGELVRLVDEAMSALQLVREAALKVQADRAKMAEIIELAKSLHIGAA